ncbi:MAG: filamentous hemagglutinin N-terminal domain-containing protein [Gammaproteobacteria bacterium]|nr:filamentous hemagglutinin N-terminal domain-containing protein [Gammaproteobacteria bacterium]
MNVKKQKLGLLISTLLGAQSVYALPQGAQVVQGTAAITRPSDSVLNIQNTNKAIINWNQFNIGNGQTVNFHQPSSSSSVLNNVISNTPSHLLGNLNSNGQVYLINQNGILVGEGARINTNGFFASTLKMTNEDYLNGELNFHGGGIAGIDNQGYIHAGENGHVVFIAPDIRNGGVIEVDNGNVILAAGKSITIKSLDNAHIEFNIQGSDDTVTNLGEVIAHNGAANLFAGSLKHSGAIKATKLIKDANGNIRLVALDKVEVSGTLDASGEKGGDIQVLGEDITIQANAIIDASGTNGGGEILIGGDQQGLNPDIQNATSTSIEKEAIVTTSATQTGDGGRVIIFAENDVHVHGEVSAKGGALSGDGGFIETSGLKQLDITSVPDASAENGEAGEWLIDPNNITIISAIGNDDAAFTASPTSYTSSADSTTLDDTVIETALNEGTNVTITTGSGGVEAGNITVLTTITKTDNNTSASLTLSAHNNIYIKGSILDASTSGDLDLTLNPDFDGGGANGDVIFGDGSADYVTIDLNGGTLDVNGDIVINVPSNFGGGKSRFTFRDLVWNKDTNLSFSGYGDILFENSTINNSSDIDFDGFGVVGYDGYGGYGGYEGYGGSGGASYLGIKNNTVFNNSGATIDVIGHGDSNGRGAVLSIESGADFNNLTDGVVNVSSAVGSPGDVGGLSASVLSVNGYGGASSFVNQANATVNVSGLSGSYGGVISQIVVTNLGVFTNQDTATVNLLDNGGTAKFGVNSGVLNLTGGRINNAENLAINSTLNWDGGTISGLGSIDIPVAATVNMHITDYDLVLDTIQLSNFGTMNLTSAVVSTPIGDDVILDNGANWVNESGGVINLGNTDGAVDISNNVGTEGSLINKVGGVINTTTTNGMDIWNPFDNQGVLNIGADSKFEINDVSTLSGTINLSQNGLFYIGTSGNAVLTLSATASVNDVGALGSTFQIGSTSDSSPGASVLNVGATAFTLPSSMTLSLNMEGTINNAENLTIPNTFTWSGGTVTGAAGQTFTIPSTTTVNMTADTDDVTLDTVNLSNLGIMTYSSADSSHDLWIDNNAILTNNNVFNFQNDNDNASIEGATPEGKFVNAIGGVINSSPTDSLGAPSTPTIKFYVALENYGIINVAANTSFETNDPTLHSGTIDIASGGIFQLDQDPDLDSIFTFSGTPVVQGFGSFIVDNESFLNVDVPVTFASTLTLGLDGSGEIRNAQNLIPPDTFNWSGGTIKGTGTGVIPATSTFNILGTSGDMFLDGFSLSNATGTLNMDIPTGRTFNVQNGADLVIANALAVTGSGTFSLNDLSGLSLSAAVSTASTLTFDLVGGIVDGASNLGLPNTFNWKGGMLRDSAYSYLAIPSTTTVNMPTGFVDNVLQDMGMDFDGTLNLDSGSTFVVAGSSNNMLEIADTATLTGSGTIEIQDGRGLNVGDGVNITPELTIEGVAFFEGGATLSTLNLHNGLIFVDTQKDSSIANPKGLTIEKLVWEGGLIQGDGIDSAFIKTTGQNSRFTSGTLKEISWGNSGSLTWGGNSSSELNFINASFENSATGVLKIKNDAALNGNESNLIDSQYDYETDYFEQFGIGSGQYAVVGYKGINTSNSVFVNKGELNLDGVTLDLGGITLKLSSSSAILSGNGKITGDVENSAGTVSISNPSGGAGSLEIVGDYLQGADGTLAIRILDASSFDTFSVGGTATLNGTLSLSYVGNANLPVSFSPFTFVNRDGVFSSVTDSKGSILAIDLSNGTFTIIGGTQTGSDLVSLQDSFEEVIEKVEQEESEKTLAFLKEVIEVIEEDEEDEEVKKKKAAKLVCK